MSGIRTAYQRANRTPVIVKRQPYGRCIFLRYDESSDRIVYRHPTKGVLSRKYTSALFRALCGPTPQAEAS